MQDGTAFSFWPLLGGPNHIVFEESHNWGKNVRQFDVLTEKFVRQVDNLYVIYALACVIGNTDYQLQFINIIVTIITIILLQIISIIITIIIIVFILIITSTGVKVSWDPQAWIFFLKFLKPEIKSHDSIKPDTKLRDKSKTWNTYDYLLFIFYVYTFVLAVPLTVQHIYIQSIP